MLECDHLGLARCGAFEPIGPEEPGGVRERWRYASLSRLHHIFTHTSVLSGGRTLLIAHSDNAESREPILLCVLDVLLSSTSFLHPNSKLPAAQFSQCNLPP
jgi:hypothetical protein